MEQRPRLWLRIFLIEEGEKGIVSEVLKAGGVVGHAIHVSWEVVRVVAVSVSSLVEAGDVAEEGGRSIRADGSFRLTGDGRGVVTSIRDGGKFDVVSGCP